MRVGVAKLALAAASILVEGVTAGFASPGEKIEPGIREYIVSGEPARVLVDLISPFDEVEECVLNGSSRDDYELIYTYSHVSATAMTIVTEAALDLFALSECVLYIGFDEELEDIPDLDPIEIPDVRRKLLEESIPLVDADKRHALGNTGNGVTVAVLDTGINRNHEYFPPGSIVHEACFGSLTCCPNGPGVGAADDDIGHGTRVASVIASRGRQRFGEMREFGMAPGASIVAIKVKCNSFLGYGSDVIGGLNHIIANPQLNVNVVNLSFGSRDGFFMSACDQTQGKDAWFQAIETLRNRNILTIAATGNSAQTDGIALPSCFSNTVAVGASLSKSTNRDTVWNGGNRNAHTNLLAPGDSLTYSGNPGVYYSGTGTSFSSPHVAGCAALLYEAGQQSTAQDIQTRLESSTVSITDTGSGLAFPRLDCSPDPELSPAPSSRPSSNPSGIPSKSPMPSSAPSSSPSATPSNQPSPLPSPTAGDVSPMPSSAPSSSPSATPSTSPSKLPSASPSSEPSDDCSNVPPIYPPAPGPSFVGGNYWVPPLSTPGVDCEHKRIKIPNHGTYTCMEVGKGICRDNGGNFGEWRFGIDTVAGPNTPDINENWTYRCPLQCPDESTYPSIIDPATKSYPLIGPYIYATGNGPTRAGEICKVDGVASPADCRYAGTTHVCIGENTEDDPNKFTNERPYMFFYDEKRHEFLYQLVCDGAGDLGKLPQLKMVNNEDLATQTYVNYPVDIAKFKKGATADPTDANELWDIYVDWNGYVDPVTRRIGKLAAFTKFQNNFCTEYVEATSTACWEKGANCANVQTSDSNDLRADC